MSASESGGQHLFFDSMGKGTWVALKLLPDFLPKVRDDVPGVSCGFG